MNAKEKIEKGFIELSKIRNTTNITVVDICDHLKISRKTFYNYFPDRQAITEKIFIDRVEKTIHDCLKYGINTKNFMTAIYNSYLEEKDFFAIAIQENGQNSLFDTIISRMEIVFNIIFRDIIENKTELEYLSYKFASLQAMLLKKWMKNGMKESPEFMTQMYLVSIEDYENKHNEIVERKHIW